MVGFCLIHGLAFVALKTDGPVRERAGVEVVAVFETRALPTDIRHNSKIDRAALSRWSEKTLRGERAEAL